MVRRSLGQTRAGVYFKSPKNKRGRPVVLPGFTIEVLNEHRAGQTRERALFGADYEENDLVCSMPDGSPWRPNSFSAEFRRFRDTCGLKIRYHDLRHSHATQLMMSGEHPKVVSERLGHSSVKITMDLYSHVLPGMQEKAAQRTDAALRAAMKRHQSKAIS